MREIWKEIPELEDYQVSNLGNIMSSSTLSRWGNTWRVQAGQMLKGNYSNGYKTITIRKKKYSVHSLVMLAFIGERPYKYDINHKNGIKTDNRLINLEYCTRSYNVKHAWDNNLFPEIRQYRQTFGKFRFK